MKTKTKASWKGSYLKWDSGQDRGQNYRQQITEQPSVAGIADVQTLVLLPFEIMRQRLESVMLRQLEIATGICSKQAEEFDNAFNSCVGNFEVALGTTAQIHKCSSVRDQR